MDKIKGITNNSVGIIKGNIINVPNRRFMPKNIWQTACTSAPLSGVGCKVNTITAGSIALNQKQAYYGAVGELVERYSSAIYDNENFIVSSYTDLIKEKKGAFHPHLFHYYSKNQYEKFKSANIYPLDVDDPIEWVKGVDIISGTGTHVPAFSVFLPYYSKHKCLHQYAKTTTSTGLAAGSNLENAIISGFLECVERDAFCKFWYQQQEIPFFQYTAEEILKSFKNNSTLKLLLKNNHVKISIFDLNHLSHVDTTVVIMFFKYKEFDYFTLGSASRFSKLESIIKATLEAYQGMEYAISLKSKKILPDEVDMTLIDNFDKHFHFYNQYPEYRDKSPIIKSAMNRASTNDNILELKKNIWDKSTIGLNTLKSLGLKHIAYVDITPIDMIQLGFHVVRVITPELHLLSGDFNHPYLGGFSNEESLFLNQPHPFP